MSKIEEPPEEAAAKAKDEAVQGDKRQVDWPTKNIKEPHENDVLCGRGALTNHHPGNKRYRMIVGDRKMKYVNCKPQDKSLLALSIVRMWRAQQPPGRFLTKDKETGLWSDVGDKEARTKTSQALRESAPLIRKQQEGERLAAHRSEDDSDDDEEDAGNGKSTGFAGGTNMDADAVPETMLVRDHTLGREYLNEGDSLALDGFSWHASLGPTSSHPPPEAHADLTSEDPLYASQGRYESWGHISPPMPGCAYPQHSGSWTNRYPSASWRENSLGQNTLARASIDHPDACEVYDSHTKSWGPLPAGDGPQMDHHAAGGPQYPPGRPHTPPSHHRQPHVTTSSGHSHGYSPSSSSGPPSPSYSVDLTVASAWSGLDPKAIAKSWSTGSSEDSDRFRSSHGRWPRSPISDKHATTRPEIIKRATSNQNETIETKPGLRGPSVKRTALNRDSSMASNRLKEKYVLGFNKPFSLSREMRQLSANLRQTSLSGVKPKPMSEEDKQSTIDLIAMDLMVKPLRLSSEARSSTIEALGLDFDDDSFLWPEPLERGRIMEDVFKELREGVPKPSTLSLLDRLTTNDLMDIVTEPIGEGDELFCFCSSADDIGVPEFLVNSRTCDVLLGRGPRLYQHPGNVQFRKEKLLIQDQYKQATKVEKKALSQSLVDKVHSWGGKFLKEDIESGQWIVASRLEARRKAAQVLRESFTPEKRREKRLKYRSKTRKGLFKSLTTSSLQIQCILF